jgi:hypothetical protein
VRYLSVMVVVSMALWGCDDGDDGGTGDGSGGSVAGGAAAANGGTPAPSGGTPAPSGGTPAPSGGTPAPSGGTPAPAGGDAPVGGDVPVGGDPPVGGDAPVGGAAPLDECTGMCTYMEGCGSCFNDEAGECLDIEGCAAVCRDVVNPAVATCTAGIGACDEDAFQACYDDNIGEDDCAKTCRFLEGCGDCFTDEAGEECLTLAACAVVCRDVVDAAVATCLGALEACEEAAIDACYAGAGG